MRFSEHWLRSFVDPPIASAALAHRLTMGGLEVEERVLAAPEFTGVVVAKVITVGRHPNADRLTVCSVDAGEATPLTIVCGAPNVAAGQKVACARIGAKLPGGLEIRETTMRGVASRGMLCSAHELGIAEDASGILVLDPAAPIGKNLREVLDLDDPLLTLKLTPNRADCLSLVGLARETAAITATPFAPPAIAPTAVTTAITRAVRIEDAAACPRFCGRVISNIDASARSPEWMQRRLARSGIRAISAVVDVTNYVMLELGQPLHAYDDARLEGELVVRFPRPGEQLLLLNGQTLALDPDLLLVADSAKPLGLAGIMGGEVSGIGNSTTTLFLEGAFWNPAVIQGKARRLGFVTDAGYRFERGVDFASAPAAVERATQLIIQCCGGHAGPLIDVVGMLPRRDPARVRTARIARILGVTIPSSNVAEIFTRLGFSYTRDGDDFVVTPPSYRFDLAIEEDYIEEVARLYGYDHIPAAPAVHAQPMAPAVESERPTSELTQRLVDLGYEEVITFSFVSAATEAMLGVEANPIKVLNPIASHLAVMRSTLIGGLLETLRTNLNRKEERVRIFELGRCFVRDCDALRQPQRVGGLTFGSATPEQWAEARRPVDFFDTKGDVESLAWPQAVTTEAAIHPALHPGRSARVTIGGVAAGWIGELHPRLVQSLELPRAPVVFEIDVDPLRKHAVPVAKPASKLPVARRDLAVVVDDALPAQAVLAALRATRMPQVEKIALFDVYRGPGVSQGKKSLAILVLIQDTARTLTDAEIDATVASLLRVLQDRFGATLRQ